MVTKGMIAFVLASIFGICVAMTVAPPENYTAPSDETITNDLLNTGDTAWVLASTALVLIMTPGEPLMLQCIPARARWHCWLCNSPSPFALPLL